MSSENVSLVQEECNRSLPFQSTTGEDDLLMLSNNDLVVGTSSKRVSKSGPDREGRTYRSHGCLYMLLESVDGKEWPESVSKVRKHPCERTY